MKRKDIFHFIAVVTTLCLLERGVVVTNALLPPRPNTIVGNKLSLLGISGRIPSSAAAAASPHLFGTSTSEKGNADDNGSNSSSSSSARSRSKTTPRRRSNKDQWITCSSTNELVAAVKHFVKPGHKVAELGAQLREVSTAICESSASDVVLVDVKRKFPKNNEPRRTRAMRRPGDETKFFPQIASFVEIDTLDDWRKAFLNASNCPDPDYDVLVLDLNSIAGNDLEWTSLSIVREFVAIFQSCQIVLIKSVSLNQWGSRLIHGQRWITLQQQQQQRHRHPDNNYEDLQPLPLPLPPLQPQIVATVGVQEYRSTIPYAVRPGDAVLEVGCHFGTTTATLYEAAAPSGTPESISSHCIGVDVGPKIIQGARGRYPHIYFAVGDAWKTAGLLRIQRDFLLQLQQQHEGCNNITFSKDQQRIVGFDVIYVDVGGLSGGDGLIEALTLLSSLMYALEPRCIVIKSLCVRRLASALTPAWHILLGQVNDYLDRD